MTRDVLLVVANSEMRTRIKHFLNQTENEFRFLDEAMIGNIGLKKAMLLNPDIIIVELWSGVVDGYYFSKKLLENNYLSKIIIIDNCSLEPSDTTKLVALPNVCSLLFWDTFEEYQLEEALKHTAEKDISGTKRASENLYNEILSCNSYIDFALIKDRYPIRLHVEKGCHIIACKVLNDLFSCENFIDDHIEELLELLRQFNDGMVFGHNNILYIVLNCYLDPDRMHHKIYGALWSMGLNKMYFLAISPTLGLKGLKEGLVKAAELVKYGFFNADLRILYEEMITSHIEQIPDRILDDKLREIQYDLKENDGLSLKRDLNELFLQQIKFKMDMKAYYFVCNSLSILYSNLAIIKSDKEFPIFVYGKDDYVEETAQRVINLFHGLITDCNTNRNPNPIIEEAIGFIRKNYYKDISLTEVAQNAGVSSSYLSHVFKRVTGSNFSEYLIGIRTQRAKDLLKENKLKIADIASRTGFNNEKYFSKVFKVNTGYSPKEYQKKFHGITEGEITK